MYFVYVVKNLDNPELYYGYTNDLERRIKEHNSTRRCFLVYYEAFLSEQDARDRERKLKNYGQSRTHLRRRIKDSLMMT